MPKMIQVSREVYEALLDQKHRNDTFDDVIRGILETVGIIVEETYDGENRYG